jgi:hypothetical protein
MVDSAEKQNLPFPLKLYDAIEISDPTILRWINNDTAFKIFDLARFESEVIPKYFSSFKMQSFQRQINLYGFRRLKNNADDFGGYAHPLFIRGHRDHIKDIRRASVKESKAKTEGRTSPSAIASTDEGVLGSKRVHSSLLDASSPGESCGCTTTDGELSDNDGSNAALSTDDTEDMDLYPDEDKSYDDPIDFLLDLSPERGFTRKVVVNGSDGSKKVVEHYCLLARALGSVYHCLFSSSKNLCK